MVDTKEYFYKYYNPFTHQPPITQISYYRLPFLSFFNQMLYLKTALHSMSGQETSNHISLKQSNPFLSTLRDAPSVTPLLIQDQWNLSRVFHYLQTPPKVISEKIGRSHLPRHMDLCFQKDRRVQKCSSDTNS